MPQRRFPPPWSVEEPDPELDRRCLIVRDANGQALGARAVGTRRPSCSPRTTPRRIAANIAKLQELLRQRKVGQLGMRDYAV